MAWIDDLDILNDAASGADWQASGFDTPTLNDSAATTPIYVEGSACMWWPLKKGTTNGTTFTSVISGTPSMVGRVMVGFLNYPFADISLIPITSMFIRMSSSTGFTTNYAQWDASAQLLSPNNIPISGHTPIIGYPDSAVETGTPNYATVESCGWVATTGGNADGKQGGFDWFFLISWIGAHSATYTNNFLSGLQAEYYDNEGSGLPDQPSRPIAVFSRAGNFYQSNISLQMGDGSSDTANTVVSETGKTIFFNNLHINQDLGYVFVNPASTHQIHFTLTDCVHFWNDQASTNDIFKDSTNTDIFRITGCSFSEGGQAVLPPYVSDVNTYIKSSKFGNCGVIDIGDCLFEDNIVSNALVGVIYIGSTDTRRAARTSYNNNTSAVEFDTVGTYSLDGDTFSGNTSDILNSGNAATINAGSFIVGRGYKILTVGTTDYTLIGSADNVIGTKFVATGVGTGTGTATEVLVINKVNGANPATFSNTGTNADTLIVGSVSVEILVLNDDTGLPIATDARVHLVLSSDKSVILSSATDLSGIAATTYGGATPATIEGWAREFSLTGTDFVPQDIGGSITSNGFSLTVRLKPIQ